MFGTKDNAKRKQDGSAEACGLTLGCRARDTITGFEGVVTSITRWLNGCDRIGIQPTTLDKDGGVKEHQVFDALQLELIKETKHKPVRRTGGPRNEEKR